MNWILLPVALSAVFGFAAGFYRSRSRLLMKALLLASRETVLLQQENESLRTRLTLPLEVKPMGGGAYSTNRDCSADEFVAAVRAHNSDKRLRN